MKIKKLSYISDHLYRMLIIGDSDPGKTNALLNLIKKDDIGKTYFCMLKI